jgi:hypothetical protein
MKGGLRLLKNLQNQINSYVVNFKVYMSRKNIYFCDFSIFDLNFNITEYYSFKLPHLNKSSYTDFKVLNDFFKKDKKIIYVKGLFRYQYLKLFTKAIIVNLEDIGCPNAKKLEKSGYKCEISSTNNTIHNLNLYKSWLIRRLFIKC